MLRDKQYSVLIYALEIYFSLSQWGGLTPETSLATPLALYVVYKCIVHHK